MRTIVDASHRRRDPARRGARRGGAAGAGATPRWSRRPRTGDAADASRALLRQKRADVNAAGVDGTTALHWAVQRDDAAIVELLIRAGRQRQGARTATACRRCRSPPSTATPRSSKLLLEAGADPNTGLSGGETALDDGGAHRQASTRCKLLVDARRGRQRPRRARPDRADVGGGAEQCRGGPAARRGGRRRRRSAPTIRPGGGRGAQIGVFTSPPPTGFTRAPVRGARRQRRRGRARCSTPAPTSTTRCPTARARSSWRPRTRTGRWRACCSIAAPIRTSPAPAGTRCTRRSAAAGRISATRRARCRPATLDSIEVVKKLIAKGVDVNARMTKNGMKDGQRNRLNRLGATAFFLAAKNTDVEVMKVLAAAGADAKIPSADGTTPLMVAAGWRSGTSAKTADRCRARKTKRSRRSRCASSSATTSTPRTTSAKRRCTAPPSAASTRSSSTWSTKGAKLDARDSARLDAVHDRQRPQLRRCLQGAAADRGAPREADDRRAASPPKARSPTAPSASTASRPTPIRRAPRSSATRGWKPSSRSQRRSGVASRCTEFTRCAGFTRCKGAW